MIDTQLRSFATQRELDYIQAIDEHGSLIRAAKALGVARGTMHSAFRSLRHRAAIKGYSPEHNLTHPVAPGQRLRGASQLYRRGEAEPLLEWVKSTADDDARYAIQQEAFKALAESLPRVKPLPPPKKCSDALCNVYTLTDSHVGALCWEQEGGSNWNLKIAEQTLTKCFEQMIQGSPRAKVGIVAQLGDFLHTDGLTPATPTSGNILDADSRFEKIVQVAVRILRRVVDLSLMHHEQVIVLLAEGNHDPSSSVWLRTMFKALYENEPRVMVIDSPLPYYCHQHGETMLAWHHGHLKKNAELPLLFAAQFPKVWGNTTKRYAHTGHRHHSEEKEHSGMTVTQHPTLASRDAYAARGGWIAERSATAYTYHATKGRVASNTVSADAVEV